MIVKGMKDDKLKYLRIHVKGRLKTIYTCDLVLFRFRFECCSLPTAPLNMSRLGELTTSFGACSTEHLQAGKRSNYSSPLSFAIDKMI